MSYQASRIPDRMAAEVLAEATRLHAQMTSGYSLEDLQQAGLEAHIPPEVIQQAVKNVQELHSLKRVKREQLQRYIREQIQKGISGGVKLLIPTLVVSGLFIGHPSFVESIFSRLNIQNKQAKKVLEPLDSNSRGREAHVDGFQTLAVKVGKLEYLGDIRGLSIAVNQDYTGYINATVGTDGYESLEIQNGKVGNVYEYKGIYNYRIKIIEADNSYPERKVVFQIEKLGQPQSQIQRLEEKNKELQLQPAKLQQQLEEVQKERDLIKRQLEEKERNITLERDSNRQQLEQKDKQLEEMRKENIRLKAPSTSSNLYQTPANKVNKPVTQSTLKYQKLINSSTIVPTLTKEPKLMGAEDFSTMVMNKTMEQVTEELGQPSTVSDLGVIVFWRYNNKIKDPNKGYITYAIVRFENGIARNVSFN